MISPRLVTGVVATAVAFGVAGCGFDEPIDGWGPGSPPAVVVTVAPAEAPPTLPAAQDGAVTSDPASGESAAVTVESAAGASAEAPPPTAPPVPVYAPNGQTVRVRSLDNSFRAETVEVVVGTEIWWTNDGRNEHDVLPVDDDEDWGALRDVFQPGDEYRHVFLEPGTYRYYCSIHGTKEVGMVGTVVVTAPT